MGLSALYLRVSDIKGKITSFKRYDKVLYNNKEYFVVDRKSIGKIYLIDIDNNRVQVERTKRSTGEKHTSKAEIKVSLVKKVTSAKSCVCVKERRFNGNSCKY